MKPELRHDLDQLRRRIEFIEGDLAEARRRLGRLEALALDDEAEVAEAAPAQPVEARPVAPPPLPQRPVEAPVAPKEAAPPRVVREQEPRAASEPPEWRAWLRRLQLWPPEEAGESNEARLGAWWATRLGTLLAVIGVVFFGVYVSLNTPPWVKFVELCAVCAGVTFAGLWLERRMPRFGSVVFAGGLALVYFCAFAGYALPAVRVLTSPLAAAFWQVAAVLLVAGAAVARRSSPVATMAVGLGYVTALFSRSGGLHDFALVMAALLAVAAVLFHRRARWEAPSVVALPGAYAVYALVLEGGWLGIGTGAWAWLYLGGVATLFLLRDWRGARVSAGEVGAGERWFQGANSSLAVALGAATALLLYRAELATFYFGAALWLGLASALRRRQIAGDAISAVLLAKATGAVTLGVIEVADGRTTALALLVQAWVMAFGARRLRSRVLGVGAGLVAAVASGFFFVHADGVLALASWRAAGALAFVVGLAWLAAEGRRAAHGAGRAGIGRGDARGLRARVVRLGAGRRGLRGHGGDGAGLGGAGAGARGEASAVARDAGGDPGLGVLARGGRGRRGGHGLARGGAGGRVGAAGRAACVSPASRGLGGGAGGGLGHGVSGGGGDAGHALRARTVVWRVGGLPGGVRGGRMGGVRAAEVAGDRRGAGVFLGALGRGGLGRGLGVFDRGLRPRLAGRGGAGGLGAGVGAGSRGGAETGVGVGAVVEAAERGRADVDRDRAGAAGLPARLRRRGVFVGVDRRDGGGRGDAAGRALAARAAAVALGVGAWANAAWLVAAGGAEGFGPGLAAVLAVAVALVALPPGLAGEGSTAKGRAGLRWAFGLAGLELVFVAAVAQRGALDPYATVGWGLAAIGLFMTGLFARIRPYRLIGLLGLALCLPRVFLVDLSSALHRIAAFVVLGLVLLWVGFSYHRFRHLVAGEKGDEDRA